MKEEEAHVIRRNADDADKIQVLRGFRSASRTPYTGRTKMDVRHTEGKKKMKKRC